MEIIAGLEHLLHPHVFLMLVGGVVYGLIVGVLPGLNSVVALTLLLPFTMGMDAYAAFAFIVGLLAVNTTSDTIPAVVFGIPGTSGSAATIIDGHAMSKQGRTKEALGAGYTSSVIGGIFGAILLGLCIPVMGKLVLFLGTPELLAICILGISFTSSVSGRNVQKGLASACVGVLISFIGTSSQTGEQRWTFGSMYFWDGLPVIPFVLGLFALPELIDLATTKGLGDKSLVISKAGDSIMKGARAAVRHWPLVLRSSWIGAALGAVPGIGSSMIDWVAYASAARTSRNSETFGQGDIRGVIAPESSNNAKDGGSLLPALALGIPSGVGMALVLGAFQMHGITPGPEMMKSHVDLTYMLVWGLMIANILGALICLMFTNHLSRLLDIPIRYLVTVILAIVVFGAYQGSQSLGDLWLLLGVGLASYVLKQIGWPRPPLIIGLILGEMIERYLFVSLNVYGWSWVLRPITLAFLALTAFSIVQSLIQQRRSKAADVFAGSVSPVAQASASALISVAMIVLISILMFGSRGWDADTSTGPIVVGTAALVVFASILVSSLSSLGKEARQGVAAPNSGRGWSLFVPGLTEAFAIRPALPVFCSIVAFIVSAKLIGMLPSMLLIVPALYLSLGGRLGKAAAILTISLFLSMYIMFDKLLVVPWNRPLFPIVQDFLSRLI